VTSAQTILFSVNRLSVAIIHKYPLLLVHTREHVRSNIATFALFAGLTSVGFATPPDIVR